MNQILLLGLGGLILYVAGLYVASYVAGRFAIGTDVTDEWWGAVVVVWPFAVLVGFIYGLVVSIGYGPYWLVIKGKNLGDQRRREQVEGRKAVKARVVK